MGHFSLTWSRTRRKLDASSVRPDQTQPNATKPSHLFVPEIILSEPVTLFDRPLIRQLLSFIYSRFVSIETRFITNIFCFITFSTPLHVTPRVSHRYMDFFYILQWVFCEISEKQGKADWGTEYSVDNVCTRTWFLNQIVCNCYSLVKISHWLGVQALYIPTDQPTNQSTNPFV